ncbi:hypothetical protein [Rhodoferax antarcticus]|uniref:hypothetical protein n=1 Tax=Rhodoferax antarcticus TaxID=81479 RepID=UPI0013905D70|nr:hypothetical protein [Rhodoferax antarcticus]
MNKLMGAIDANPSFRNDLQTLASQLKIQTDGTDRNGLKKCSEAFVTKATCYSQTLSVKFTK